MRPCKGYRKFGGAKCDKQTQNPTGFCEDCRPDYEAIQINQMLYCSDCPLTERECPVRGRALTEHPKGPVCWYELYDEIPKLKRREHVIEASKRLIGSKLRVTLRLDRYVAAMGQYDSQLVNDFNRLAKSTFEDLRAYYAMRGWGEEKLEKSVDKKVKLLEQLVRGKNFGSESLPEPTGDEVPTIEIKEPDYDSDEWEEVEEKLNLKDDIDDEE